MLSVLWRTFVGVCFCCFVCFCGGGGSGGGGSGGGGEGAVPIECVCVWEIVFSPGLCLVFCLTIIAVITTSFPYDILALMSVYLFLCVIDSYHFSC